MLKPLNKQSTEAEIKAYFCAVLNLAKSDEEFPVNLDEVWPLVFGRKEEAVRALKNDKLFMQDIDYQVLRKNAENLDSFPQNGGKPKVGGRPSDTYMLSVPCLEFFIARKVRPVFEVYRQVFHKVAESTEVVEKENEIDLTQPIGLEDTIQPLSDYMHQVDVRWERLRQLLEGYKGEDALRDLHAEWIALYRRMTFQLSRLVHYETLEAIEGASFI